MRVLVTWGSKMGGTEGIGRIIAETLEGRGFDVVAGSADQLGRVEGFDAALVGGALYANRWPPNVRRFVRRNVHALRRIPVWFFSSGPLDDSAERSDIPAPTQVAVLAERVGALGHTTFGGRLAEDARGFPAGAMAKEHAGDWRNPEHIRVWATQLADALPQASPGTPVDHPARSIPRLLSYGVAGWTLAAAVAALVLAVTSTTASIVVHAIVTPLLFIPVAWHYFRARGARDPLPTALTFAGILALLDLFVAGALAQVGFVTPVHVAVLWLTFLLAFLVTWATGALMSTMPWPKDEPKEQHAAA